LGALFAKWYDPGLAIVRSLHQPRKEVFLLFQGKLASNAQFVELRLYSEEEEQEEQD